MFERREAMEVIVSPKRRTVYLGQDAWFDCNAADPMLAADSVQYYWQLPSALVGSGRAEYDRNRLTVVETAAADNHTDVTCLVLRSGKLLGSAKGELVVLPAMPDDGKTTTSTTTTPATTPITTTATTTVLDASTPEPTTATPTRTLAMTPSPSSTSVVGSWSTPAAEVPTSERGLAASAQAPTQRSSVTVSGGAGLAAVAPAVAVGLVLLVCLVVTGIFLLRWRRRRLASEGSDAEKGKPGGGGADHPPHSYELIGGPGDFKEGECEEENHNHKAVNGYVSRGSLKAFSRGVAPDSLGRYARVVARKDRIVNAGGHGLGLGRGAKRRPDPPVLTLSMSSLYEETTPTFVVAGMGGNGGPAGHYENVLPAGTHRAKSTEIVMVGTPPGGCIEDGDQYVTLTRVPSS